MYSRWCTHSQQLQKLYEEFTARKYRFSKSHILHKQAHMDYTNNSARVMKFCQELGCSVPPKNTPHFTVGMYLLNLSYSLLIWNASSLVWHSTTTDTSPSTCNVISDCRWAVTSHHEQTFHTVQSEPNLIFVPAILAATVGTIHLYNNCEAGNQSDV